MEADIAMETLPDGTKRSRRQIKEPVKFVPQDVPPEPKKIPIRNTVKDNFFLDMIYTQINILLNVKWDIHGI